MIEYLLVLHDSALEHGFPLPDLELIEDIQRYVAVKNPKKKKRS
ncbi:MAG: hypothetical protein OEY38_17440 [Gammaproteobacteria bacterium]|nr:hypothetical protein [Gammaproteobacteria bacterium]